MLDSEELRWTEPNDAPEQGTLAGASVAAEDEGAGVDFPAGAKLGRYVVLSHMGGGGMGVVYAAYDPELDRRIALKLMHQRGSDEAEAERASRRMLAEAKAMAQLSHPNVITVHDVGTIDGRVFIAMEFVEGVPLSEWMRTPGRDWRELLDMFTRAGRGLQAAHAAGLVHRDFKPDNVLVGADGRVRVLDFGLARRFDGSRDGARGLRQSGGQSAWEGAREGQREGSRELGDGRDREAGTPAYMSPEQHLGKPLDHRADQFSFCVALYEALYGKLPFAAKSRLELALAVTDGRVGPAPKRASVPNWLRWALLRGLDPDPEGRWEDMASLLEALSHDPYHKHRIAAVATASGVVAIGLLALVIKVGLSLRVADPAPPTQVQCTGAQGRVAEVWSDARREQVRQVFAKAGHVDQAGASEVEEGLTRWAATWATMHRETCEASAVGEQSGTMLDRRMLCLDRHLAEFAELVEVVSGVEAESYARAREAVRKLPDLSACEAAAIDAKLEPNRGTSEAEREALRELERDLFRANSLEMTGALVEAAKLAQTSADRATELGDSSLRARALLIAAKVAQAQGDLRAAMPLLEEAELAAERAHADQLRGKILIALARADVEAGDAAAAVHRVREAQAVLDRVGASELEYAALEGVAALAALAAGEPEELERAEQQLREAAKVVARLGSAPVELAELRTTLGVVLRELGRYAEARQEFEEARVLWTGAYGGQHPILATLELELARVAEREGDHDAALAGYAAAFAGFERAYGPHSLDAANASAAMAVSLGELGRHGESLRRHHAARAVFRANVRTDGDPASVALARVLDNEGLIRRELGQLDEALSLHQQALALIERGRVSAVAPVLAAQQADRARVLTHLGEVLLALERGPEARARVDEALDLLARIAASARGPAKRREARSRLAELQFLAAKAWVLGDSADPSRAKAYALEARRGLEELAEHERVAELDRWLAGPDGGT